MRVSTCIQLGNWISLIFQKHLRMLLGCIFVEPVSMFSHLLRCQLWYTHLHQAYQICEQHKFWIQCFLQLRLCPLCCQVSKHMMALVSKLDLALSLDWHRFCKSFKMLRHLYLWMRAGLDFIHHGLQFWNKSSSLLNLVELH